MNDKSSHTSRRRRGSSQTESGISATDALRKPPKRITSPAIARRLDRAFLDAVLINAPAGIALLDHEFRFLRVNAQLAEINGSSVEDHIGRFAKDVLGELIWEERKPYVERAFAGQQVFDIPLSGARSTATGKQHILGSYVPVSIDEHIIGVVAIIRDVTTYTVAQEILTRQSLAFETLFDALVITDLNGLIVDCNASFLRRVGLPREKLIGISIRHLARPEEQEALLPLVIDAVRSEGRYMGEVHYVNSSGEVRIAEMSVVPLRDSQGVLTGLIGALRDITERKRADQALRESEERYRRTALELAAAYDRERAIASQLQESLQPNFPSAVPGLTIAHYYRPALAEAEVGGDFADCFLLDSDNTALAVGDLSGKGLAAAVQVATVRNMLRFAVYNGSTLAESVAKLNHTLAEFNLVVGFATLFTGCYDASHNRLTYVNCGQEPALVYRAATDTVEELGTTSPVLGTFDNFQVEQETVDLSPGDVLAIFTDGLTEIGPRSADLLGAGGVAALLRRHAGELGNAPNAAADLVTKIIDEVTRFAGGGLRDDACLLVAIAQHRPGRT